MKEKKLSTSKVRHGTYVFYFFDDIQVSLRKSPEVGGLNRNGTVLFSTFNHHGELYDILDESTGESMFKFFKDYYLLVFSEDKVLKVTLSVKNKENRGYFAVTGYVEEFKAFLAKYVSLAQGSYTEVIFLD